MQNADKVNKVRIDKAMQELREKLEIATAGKLAAIAPQLLDGIYQDAKMWNDDLGNLSDSFAWAVYFKGQLYSKGFLREQSAIKPKVVRGTYARKSNGRTIRVKPVIWGREAAEEFIAAYKPKKSNLFEVVFVAGMYYATFLEEYGYLGGFLNARENFKAKVPYLFKSTRNFYYKPKKSS